MSEYLGWNDEFEAQEGGSFLVHPEGWEGPCLFESIERITEGDHIKAVILKLDCDGAKVRDYISLKTTDKYDLGMIKWKVSGPLISAGLRSHGDPVHPSDLMKLEGRRGRVKLTVEKFQSKKGPTAGKWLETNKVDRYLEKAAGTSQKPTTQKMKEEKPSYDF